MKSAPGVCPGCGSEGSLGDSCNEHTWGGQDFHFVPRRFAAKFVDSPAVSRANPGGPSRCRCALAAHSLWVDGQKVDQSRGTFKVSVCAKSMVVKHARHGELKSALQLQEKPTQRLSLRFMGWTVGWRPNISGGCFVVETAARRSDPVPPD